MTTLLPNAYAHSHVYDVYHIAHLLLEKDLRLGPPQYPHQKATIYQKDSLVLMNNPDNPPISLRIGKSKDPGYGSNRLTLDRSFLFLQGPLVFGHNLFENLGFVLLVTVFSHRSVGWSVGDCAKNYPGEE
jgi:hypothetical protein